MANVTPLSPTHVQCDMANNNNALWIGLGVFFGVVLVLAVAVAGGWYMFKPDIRTFGIYKSYQKRFGSKARESVSLDSSRRSSLANSRRSSLASSQRSSSARVTLHTDDNTAEFVAEVDKYIAYRTIKRQYDANQLSLDALDRDNNLMRPVSRLTPQHYQNIDTAQDYHRDHEKVNTILRNMKSNLNQAILDGK